MPPKRIPVFVPNPKQGPPTGIDPDKKSLSGMTMAEALGDAERRLGYSLPLGYHSFMHTVGPGVWCDARIRHPEYLYTWEAPPGVTDLVIADNVDGCGNFVGFNHHDGAMYYLCHDPVGYALVGSTFEEWIYSLTAAWMKDGSVLSDDEENFVEFSLDLSIILCQRLSHDSNLPSNSTAN